MKVILYIIVVIGLFACNTAKINTTWKASNITYTTYKRVLVLCLMIDKDSLLQKNMETELCGHLKKMGYDAVASYNEFGYNVFDGIDENNALLKLKKNNIDAVVTIVLLNKEKESKYTPGKWHFAPYKYYNERFIGYSTTLYCRIYEPGYYTTNTRYFWETNLYNLKNEQLIYNAQTRSFSFENTDSLSSDYSKLIIRSMLKQQVIESNTTAP